MKRKILKIGQLGIAAAITTSVFWSAPLAVAQSASSRQLLAGGSISGVVRDSRGQGQMGAMVQLLRPDASILATIFTDEKGHYSFSHLPNQEFAIKALGDSFLPTLREHVHPAENRVVNLTLNTLYDVMQWVPPTGKSDRTSNEDDWRWTLRSAANRPLLRWLEDGPLVVVSNDSDKPTVKTRVETLDGDGTFMRSGNELGASVTDTRSAHRVLMGGAQFSTTQAGEMSAVIGMRKEVSAASTLTAAVALQVDPEVHSGQNSGIALSGITTSEALHVIPDVDIEVGSEETIAGLANGDADTLVEALPFATIAWHGDSRSVHYRVATAPVSDLALSDTAAAAWLPNIALRNGDLVLEHGFHQELGLDQNLSAGSKLRVLVFTDNVQNPLLEASGHLNGMDAANPSILMDRGSGLLRAAAPNYSTVGAFASIDQRLPTDVHLRINYANGDTMVLPSNLLTAEPAGQTTQNPAENASLAQVIAGTHTRRTQMFSVAMSGVSKHTGSTQWRTNYRWQPADTMTPVALFVDDDGDEPYWNVEVRQPIHLSMGLAAIATKGSSRGLEVLVDLRNLLAEGYRPVVTSDGSLLFFAQDQRTIRAGLAFNF